MKSRLFFAVSFSLVVLFLTGCEPYLLYEDAWPEFKAVPDKALCVVIRPTGFAGGAYSPLWLDSKLVSGTTGNTVTSFTVEPGEHLVITKISIKTKVKFNFQAGKVYYLMQAVFPVPMIGTSTSLTPVPCEEATAKLEQEQKSLKYSRSNPNKEQEDLSAEEVKEELEDWDKWSKENPEKAKVEIEYSGC